MAVKKVAGPRRYFPKDKWKKKEIKELVEVLHSKEIQDFINKEYKGAVLPVSE